MGSSPCPPTCIASVICGTLEFRDSLRCSAQTLADSLSTSRCRLGCDDAATELSRITGWCTTPSTHRTLCSLSFRDSPFPVAHSAGNDTKQRMRCRPRSGNLLTIPLRRPALELATEMLPLVEELPFRLGDRPSGPSGCDDPSRIERVATRRRLIGNGAKVDGDAGHWIVRGAKALKLRVPRVAASATEEHRLCKERLAPECDESGGVEMARVECPETHQRVQRSKRSELPIRLCALRTRTMFRTTMPGARGEP